MQFLIFFKPVNFDWPAVRCPASGEFCKRYSESKIAQTQTEKEVCPNGNALSGHSIKLGKLTRALALLWYSVETDPCALSRNEPTRRLQTKVRFMPIRNIRSVHLFFAGSSRCTIRGAPEMLREHPRRPPMLIATYLTRVAITANS